MSFTRALVEEVISDVSLYTPELIRETAVRVTNRRQFCDEPPEEIQLTLGEEPVYFLRAPRNSILARPVDAARDKPRHDTDSINVYYPFFSSHFSLPIKPGEQVWTFSEGGNNYWVSRVCEPLHVEDVNFTHGDRNILPVVPPPVLAKEEAYLDEEGFEIDRVPRFPNGNNIKNRTSDDPEVPTPEEFALLDQAEFRLKELRDYEVISEENLEVGRIVYEPVPRLTKRPGDLTIQGSNNTTITLGTERGYGLEFSADENPDFSNADPAADATTGLRDLALGGGMGAIDIVAGRGRFPLTSAEKDYSKIVEASKDADPDASRTQPRIIANMRSPSEAISTKDTDGKQLEVDKNLGIDSDKAPEGANIKDISEGDPDFLYDASRVYLSMRSSPDDFLDLPLQYPLVPAVADVNNVGVEVQPVEDSASIIVKSDEIRIVARQEPLDAGSEPMIQGSIKIIKEGIPDAEDGSGSAVIMLQPDGTIMIDGPKIVIGSGVPAGEDDNGAGNQLALGVGAVEPIVLGTQLQGILSAIINVLDNHIHPTGTGPSGKRVAGGSEPFGPTNFTNTTDDITDLKLMLSKLGKTL